MSRLDVVPTRSRDNGSDRVRPRVATTVTQFWHRVPGGTATSIAQLVAAVADRGDVDQVLVGARGVPPDDGFALPLGIPSASLPLPVAALYDSWDRFGRPRIEPVAGGVDLIHLTVPMGPPACRVPLVATVHDVFPLTRPEWFSRRGVRLMSRALLRIRERAAVVMVPSQAVADDCLAHGFDAARLSVVPWGSRPVSVTGEEVDAARRRHGLIGPYVLFVGTVEPRKGLPVLTDALARIGRADLTLVVAGPLGWGLDAAACLSSVPGPVIRTGFLPVAELDALRAGSAVCCAPSWAEGFGLPALEALAAGAPLVTSAGTALAEVAGSAALTVPPGRGDLLADAVARLLDDDDLASELRSAGPRRASEFTWSATAAATVETYRRVINGRARR